MVFALLLKPQLGETPHHWLVWFLQNLVQKWSKQPNASKHASTIKYFISLPLWLPHSSLKSYFNSGACALHIGIWINFQLLLARAFDPTVLDAKTMWRPRHNATPILAQISSPFPMQKNSHLFSVTMAPVAESTEYKNIYDKAERVQEPALCSCPTECCDYPDLSLYYLTSIYLDWYWDISD